MEIFQIVGIGITVLVLYLMLYKIRPEIAIVLLIACAIMLSFWGLQKLADLMMFIKNLAVLSGMDESSAKILLKCIGIGLVSETGSSICKDGGLTSVGEKIQWIGKILITIEIIPFFKIIIDTVKDLLLSS